MRLSGVSLALPSQVLTNDDVIARVHQHSAPVFSGDLGKTLDLTARMLELSGARTRYWCAQGEGPIGLIRQAVTGALAQAGCSRADVDLMICAGVDRAFAEPANAHFIAHALGMDDCQCFDVLDACNGWMRATLLAQSLLATGACRRVLIINSECNQFEGGAVNPGCFALRDAAELDWKFAGLTLGEGATATILERDAADASCWKFYTKTRADLAALCTVPLAGYQRYLLPADDPGPAGAGQFSSRSSLMFGAAVHELVALIQQVPQPWSDVRAMFTHAASAAVAEVCARQVGMAHLVRNVYADCGNLVSASIPAGIARAVADGSIVRGDRMLCCVGSAGMTFSIASGYY